MLLLKLNIEELSCEIFTDVNKTLILDGGYMLVKSMNMVVLVNDHIDDVISHLMDAVKLKSMTYVGQVVVDINTKVQVHHKKLLGFIGKLMQNCEVCYCILLVL